MNTPASLYNWSGMSYLDTQINSAEVSPLPKTSHNPISNEAHIGTHWEAVPWGEAYWLLSRSPLLQSGPAGW